MTAELGAITMLRDLGVKLLTMNAKNLTETIITIYNTKQLVDNMNKIIFLALVDEDLFQLIEEKFDVKAEVEEKTTSSSKTSRDEQVVRWRECGRHFQHERVRRNDHRDQQEEYSQSVYDTDCWSSISILITDTMQWIKNLEDTVTKTIFWNCTTQSQSEITHKQKTWAMTKSIQSGWGPDGADGESPKVHGRTWRKYFGSIGTFSARAIVDHRPLKALSVQEGWSITTLSSLSSDECDLTGLWHVSVSWFWMMRHTVALQDSVYRTVFSVYRRAWFRIPFTQAAFQSW